MSIHVRQLLCNLPCFLAKNVGRINPRSTLQLQPHRNYAKPAIGGIQSLGKKGKIGKGGPALEKKVLPVETDANKLVNYLCGSNLNVTGEDVKLKEDHEYPEWLWQLHTGKPPPIEELDPDSEYYWYRVRKLSNRRSTQLQKLKKF